MELKCQFASDNYSGICPDALSAMEEANTGFMKAYGEDLWTIRAADKLREFFETDCEVFFVFNGTAANALSLASLCQSYHSVVCTEHAHIETDECGAPEFFSNGTKILHVSDVNGKIDLNSARKLIAKRNDIHFPKPRVLSITQPTELGTVYTPEELNAMRDFKEEFDLKLHVDGARFANAVSSLDVKPADITWKSGVDVLCLGGTKNGMAAGESIIFFNRELSFEFEYRCKQAGQLASKMRFLSAPWAVMLENGAWLNNARHANKMAEILCVKLKKFPVFKIAYPREANSVFVRMPDKIFNGLKERGWHFYNFIGTDCYRLMCSWLTRESDIDELIKDVENLF